MVIKSFGCLMENWDTQEVHFWETNTPYMAKSGISEALIIFSSFTNMSERMKLVASYRALVSSYDEAKLQWPCFVLFSIICSPRNYYFYSVFKEEEEKVMRP